MKFATPTSMGVNNVGIDITGVRTSTACGY